MTEQNPPDPQNNPNEAKKDPAKGPEQITQPVQYSKVSARVPEKLNRGVFATHALVLTGGQEMVCDFLLRMVPPFQLAARVVLPYSALGPLAHAISENLDNYRARFGVPPSLPAPPPNMPQPNIVEVYEQLKITDEVAVASYANTLMITHSPSEFCMDFILDVFPRPTVTQRIYMSAAQIPPFLATLRRTLDQLQQRMQGPGPQGPPQGQQPPQGEKPPGDVPNP